MRAAVYLRRSTEEHQQASLHVQREEALRYIAVKGWTCAPQHVFEDDAVSRAEFKRRPGLISLLNAAGQRSFDVVVTRDETRLGGDLVRTTLLIEDILDAGVQLFYYVSDQEVRLDDATAKFMIAAKNFAAELEREKIASRTAEHLTNKAKKGLVVGGRCYGYDNREVMEGDRRVRVEFAINEAEAEVVREIFQRYASGEGLKRIVKELNRRGIPSPRSGKRGTGSWSPTVIHEMLRRSRYVGVIEYGRHRKSYKGGTKVRTRRDDSEVLRIEAPQLRIVDEATWHQVQARIASSARATTKGGRPQHHLLSGIARCAQCGGPLAVTNHRLGTENVRVYVCSYNRSRGAHVCSNTARRPVEKVNSALLQWIQAKVLSPEVVAEVVRRVRAELDSRAHAASYRVPELEKEARALRTEVGRLVDAIATMGQSTALIQALADRERRLAEVESQVRAQQRAPDSARAELARLEAEAHRRVEDINALFDRNPEEARRAVASLFEGGRLTAKPIETPQGKRFLLEGTAVIGRILLSERSDGPNRASPTGFEPVLQP